MLRALLVLAVLLTLLAPARSATADPGESDVDLARFTSAEALLRFGPLSGQLVQRSLASAALGRNIHYWVALPPGFETGQRYPVMYLLHGMAGHPGELLSYGFIQEAGRLMASGEIPRFIFILPHGDQGYWMNQFNGPRWGDMVTQDLVRDVDARYPTLAERRFRGIAGVSMGGHGALQLALNRPDLFAVVAAHSPALRPRDRGFAFMGDEAHFRTIDPVALANRAGLPPMGRLWIDIGATDPWVARALTINHVLTERRVPHSFSVRPGGHDAGYWSGNVGDYVRFYGDAFSY